MVHNSGTKGAKISNNLNIWPFDPIKISRRDNFLNFLLLAKWGHPNAVSVAANMKIQIIFLFYLINFSLIEASSSVKQCQITVKHAKVIQIRPKIIKILCHPGYSTSTGQDGLVIRSNIRCLPNFIKYVVGKNNNLIETLRPQFSLNPTFENLIKNHTF